MEEIEKELHELKKKLWKEQELHKKEREVQQHHIQQGVQHVQTDETVPVQVVDLSYQQASGRKGEPLQEQNFTHGIQQELQQLDVDMEQQELEQNTNLMPHHQQVKSPTSLHPDDEKVSSELGGIEILGDQPEGEMHKISFNESQHRVVQYCRVLTPKDHTSPTQVEEQVIMTNVHEHLAALTNAARMYPKAKMN